MNLTKNGITIEVPDAQVVDLVLQQLNGNGAAIKKQKVIAGDAGIELPAIGEYWSGQGGTFAGLMRDYDCNEDYALILGPSLGQGTFKELTKKAEEVEVDGHEDFRLPLRTEQSLLYANLKDQFEPKWYWSCERRPVYEAFAYAQNFLNGDQHYWLVVYDSLGVAVRWIYL